MLLGPDPARRLRLASAAVGAAIVLVLAVAGVLGSSAPESQALRSASRDVVIVSVPGLRWQDLAATETPHLDRWLRATALLSVRAIGDETSSTEGYLTLGSGNRVEAPHSGADRLVDGRCVPDLAADATSAADDDLNGAEPGALGTALSAAGVTTSVFGSQGAIAALMDGAGCVASYSAALPAGTPAGVSLVELDGLERTEVAAERAALLASFDRSLGGLSVPRDALVLVVAPSAVDDGAEVLVTGLADGGGAPPDESLVSPTTRRADYVTLSDVAPTVLSALTIDVPDAMNGTVIATTAAPDGSAGDRVGHLADLAERVSFRDRAVGPVSVVMVVLIVLCGAAALGRRSRLARMLAPIVVAYPSVAFLSGLTQYHQLPLDAYVVMVTVAAMVLASVVVSACSRWGAAAPVTVLAGVLWVTMVVDVATGGRLQINTPLGYTPTIAGRFQGFGNLSFGLVGAAALASAVGLAVWRRAGAGRPFDPVLVPGWAAFVGMVTVISVSAPAFGSDVGGTLAVAPAFTLLVTLLVGRRVRWRGVLAAIGVTVGLVAVLAFVDLSRPAESRTHLGRFLDRLLRGEGGLILRRKLRGNLTILTGSVWSVVLLVLIVGALVLAWQRRDSVRASLADRPVVTAFLAASGVMALLGFALNDSGIAVPAAMFTIAVPWLVAVLVPVVKRAR